MVRETVRLFSFILAIFLVASVASATIGVSGDVYIKGILRGGYGVAELTVSNGNDYPIVPRAQSIGDTASWITFDPKLGDVVIEPHSAKQVNIIVEPPTFTPNGVYIGELIFASSIAPGVTISGGGSGLSVVEAVGVNVFLEVSDLENANLKTNEVVIGKQEECKAITFFVTTSNLGNVELVPVYEVSVTNTQSEKVTKTQSFVLNSLRPTLKRTDTLEMGYDGAGFLCLPKGEYSAVITGRFGNNVFYEKSDISFSILEKGALSIRGSLNNVTHKPEGQLGAPLKVVGTFENLGESTERVKLKVEAYKEDRLTDVITGEEFLVSPGTTSELSAYFVPKELGKYSLYTSAAFGGKSTELIKTDITVVLGTTIIVVVSGIILVSVLAVVLFIVKKIKSRR